MLSLLLSGDGTVASETTTRAQLPLLLNQLVVTTTYAIEIAEETDAAQDISVYMGATLVQIDQATETSEALNVTVVSPPGIVFVPIDIADETDDAFNVTVVGTPSGTFPGAYPSSTTYPWSGTYYQIDIAEETDEAFAVTVSQRWWRPVSARTGLTLTAVTSSTDPELTPVVPV